MAIQAAVVGKRRMALLGVLLLACTVVFAGIAGLAGSAPARALDLPTWEDVEAAKKNQASADRKVKEIEGLIAESEVELERLREESARATEAARQAELAFQEAAVKSETLEEQAEESREEAEAAAEQAASFISQMYRSGGVDRSLELFLETDADTADALLERLATMSKASERNTKISEHAEQSMNTAASLGEQAEVARAERERLSAEAEAQAKIAAEAAASQLEKITAQEAQQEVLETQLAALKDTTTKTVAGYKERLRIEEERRRKAEEEARRRAEEAARQQSTSGGGGGGGSTGGGGGGSTGGGGGGGTSSSGWAVPIPYSYISTYYQQWSGHTGIDLVNGCGTPIVAARSGTIAGVGWLDPLGGNMIYLDHSSGYQTRYAHLSRFAVSLGQHVNQGQIIGYVGTTGASTGCHLHYEVLLQGTFQNPINYI
ncbi:M23 family metallopeptidase [Leucobacter weissii]|uniref:M23 family metallopeptidase n=1 Tax=Leucobacter weissii TaxID=1983706 RepID=A0A939MNF3_9MICO|nr:M23 family metallopeptidase [Leucobacter weissii]MBO1901656.1 M23 family metallopeptidase [Leucobacter weissii]